MVEHLEADIIIIGAGCVLASHLTEAPNLQVITLEAGTRARSLLDYIPGMTIKLIGNLEADWAHIAEPDPSFNGQQLRWSAGRMIGGDSINGLAYIRGLQRDYDDWKAAGCSGWSWADVEPYFRKAEGFEDDSLPSMGKDGPLGVSRIAHYIR
jgi:choline dehydrogenase